MPGRPDSVDETVASVSGNGAYDIKGCHEAIAERGDSRLPNLQERRAMEGLASWRHSPQRHPGGYAPAGQENLEENEPLPPAQSCQDQDAFLQAAAW